jgi:hypothetical protein
MGLARDHLKERLTHFYSESQIFDVSQPAKMPPMDNSIMMWIGLGDIGYCTDVLLRLQPVLNVTTVVTAPGFIQLICGLRRRNIAGHMIQLPIRKTREVLHVDGGAHVGKW